MACGGAGAGGGCGDSELEVEIGDGSDMRGRADGGMAPELLDCLAELGDPAPSLADEVRLPGFAWSSGWVAVWDF
jgi:hypothetical protein